MKTSFVKKFMVIALALAMVFTFAACGGSNDSGSGDDGGEAGAAVLKIGSSGPLTGGASIYGVAVKQLLPEPASQLQLLLLKTEYSSLLLLLLPLT